MIDIHVTQDRHLFVNIDDKLIPVWCGDESFIMDVKMPLFFWKEVYDGFPNPGVYKMEMECTLAQENYEYKSKVEERETSGWITRTVAILKNKT